MKEIIELELEQLEILQEAQTELIGKYEHDKEKLLSITYTFNDVINNKIAKLKEAVKNMN